MLNSTIKRSTGLYAVALFGLILLSLQLMSSATQESSDLSEMYTALLLVNALASVVLLGLIGPNIYSLVRQLKKREAGSRLATRMVSLFVLLAMAPAAIVFYFSMQFLHQSIDSWFNVEMDRAMDDALELSQASLAQQMRWYLRQTRQLKEQLEDKAETQIVLELERIRETAAASEVTVFSRKGRIIASSSINPSDILPNLPSQYVWLQLKQNTDHVSLEPIQDQQLLIRVVVRLGSEEKQYLQVLYSVPLRIADLADSVEFASLRYQQMNFLRDSLQMSFSLVLSLVLLMSLLAAIWIAFISIRNIIAPVKELVKGTRAVAAGDYEQRLPVMSQDDLGFLVESFNEMMQRIAIARDEIRMTGLEVENQRAYLETILSNLTAGVISFDADYKIRTANQAAYRIFHVPVSRFVGRTLLQLADENTALADSLASIQSWVEQGEDIWQQRIAFLGFSGRQELLCRGTGLFSQQGDRVGAVVVFDDVTDLIQAQKNAAWGEVARRLAHEIKNPLTPIQLSAERLQHKLAKELKPESAEILQRSTKTIVQQVEAMKHMVDDFSRYAKPAKKQAEELDLLNLVQEVLALYSLQSGVSFKVNCDTVGLIINADPVSIRQVVHNVIKNAIEATENQGYVDINLQRIEKNNANFIELAFYDDGPGVSAQQLDTIFDPYVTSKEKGTGLGLAIVKKIIEEHGGVIWVDNTHKPGAGFVIQLPAV